MVKIILGLIDVTSTTITVDPRRSSSRNLSNDVSRVPSGYNSPPDNN